MLKSTIATSATIAQVSALRAREPVSMPRSVTRGVQLQLIVRALEMGESLAPCHLAILEPETGQPVAADRVVGAAGGRDEGEAAHGHPGGGAGVHAINLRPRSGPQA